MILRNLLLRAYPRSWRDEYGAEVAGILARTRLTPGMVADVLGGAARQHFYRDEPWRICGAGLGLWNLMLLLFVRAGFLSDRSSFLWCYAAGLLSLFEAGAWTVVRRRSGVWRATAASAKAALVGHFPIVMRYLFIFRPWGGSVTMYGRHSMYYWFSKTLAVSLLASAVLGLAGALLGKFLTGFRGRLRET